MNKKETIMRLQEVLDCGQLKCVWCRNKLIKVIKTLKEEER